MNIRYESRVVEVGVIVRRENINGGTATNAAVRRHIASLELGDGIVAGHIIAKLLGGRGDDMSNIVPMHHNGFNNADYKSFESEIRREVADNGVEARIIVQLIYRPLPSNLLLPRRQFDSKQAGRRFLLMPRQIKFYVGYYRNGRCCYNKDCFFLAPPYDNDYMSIGSVDPSRRYEGSTGFPGLPDPSCVIS